MARVRRSPERGRFELVFDGFEPLVPAAFRVRRGVGNERSMNLTQRANNVVRTPHHLVFRQASMHLEHDRLVPKIIFLTCNGTQNGGGLQRGRPWLKKRERGHVFSRLEGIEVRHPGSVKMENHAKTMLAYQLHRRDVGGPLTPASVVVGIPPLGVEGLCVIPAVDAAPRTWQTGCKGAGVARTVQKSERIPRRLAGGRR